MLKLIILFTYYIIINFLSKNKLIFISSYYICLNFNNVMPIFKKIQ